MVNLLLQFIPASRTGNWALHLLSVRRTLLWMFAYDRQNYSRYMTLFWCEMQVLQHSHPSLHDKLADGEFCVQRSDSSAFGQIPVDQVIEQTFNHGTKTKGGIIGFSLRQGAVQKWIVNAHQQAEITRNCLHMAGLDNSGQDVQVQKEGKAKRLQKDEQAVQSLITTLSPWKNPFACSSDEPMSNISSGRVTPEDVSSDMLSAYEVGEKHLKSFVEDCMMSSTIPFHEALPSAKLK